MAIVSVASLSGAAYPSDLPFNAGEPYPESSFCVGAKANAVYSGVRECLYLAGLDRTRYGASDWNPLSDLIEPGQTVLLKPNFVKEFHPRDPEGWRYVITHGSVIRAIADYVFLALRGLGRVIVADAPQTDSSFAAVRRLAGLDALEEFYRARGLRFDALDLRKEEWEHSGGVITKRRKIAGDPAGYIRFDLAGASEFASHSGAGRYYGADYDAGEVNRHHSDGRHEYLVAGTAIQADVVISLPKLKTHKKAGITGALKNLVGINGDKNWLPHHTEGAYGEGGDERPRGGWRRQAERWLVGRFRELSLAMPGVGPVIHRAARRGGRHVFGDTETAIRSGNWWGNDTIWRTCLDLNKILLYGRPDGTLRAARPESRKPHYVLMDGVVAGEGSGPMNPDPVAAGLLLFGSDAACVDAAAASLIGFDPDRIPIIRQAFLCRELPVSSGAWRDVRLVSSRPEWNCALAELNERSTMRFRPHFGWEGHIERERRAGAAA